MAAGAERDGHWRIIDSVAVSLSRRANLSAYQLSCCHLCFLFPFQILFLSTSLCLCIYQIQIQHFIYFVIFLLLLFLLLFFLFLLQLILFILFSLSLSLVFCSPSLPPSLSLSLSVSLSSCSWSSSSSCCSSSFCSYSSSFSSSHPLPSEDWAMSGTSPCVGFYALQSQSQTLFWELLQAPNKNHRRITEQTLCSVVTKLLATEPHCAMSRRGYGLMMLRLVCGEGSTASLQLLPSGLSP